MTSKKNPKPRARTRRHGYRGYGSAFAKGASYGGAVHWGRGFAGVEVPAGPSVTLSGPRLFSDERRSKISAS